MAAPDHARVVVFDFDGTLADTWRDIATALNRTLSEAGFPEVAGPEVRTLIGDGARKLLERGLPSGHRTEAQVSEMYARFSEHYARGCLETTEVYPGMIETLEELAGSVLAIASNKPSRFLGPILAGLGLEPYFGIVVGGDELEFQKPDPRVLHHVVERAGPDVEEVWMVGDSAVDVATGRAAGARTVGCAWGLRGREELRAARPDFLLDAPREIAATILARR